MVAHFSEWSRVWYVQKMNRLDLEMVRRGLAKSRTAAAELIRRGNVMVNGAPARKPSTSISEEDTVTVTATLPYVSRSGEKLEAALNYWNINVVGLTVADVGSSTGGFTDCALSRGALHVYAIDVGTEQLDATLRNDPRVTVMEGTDVRTTTLPVPIDLVVVDVSFISLTQVLPSVVGLLAPHGTLVALIKPQFEVGKENVGKGGIVRDDAARNAALDRIVQKIKNLEFSSVETIPSPITGKDGNQEYLVYATRA